LITELAVGVITYKASGETHTLSVAWGLRKCFPDKVTILAETAERPHEIDVERAQKAKDRAEQRLKSSILRWTTRERKAHCSARTRVSMSQKKSSRPRVERHGDNHPLAFSTTYLHKIPISPLNPDFLPFVAFFVRNFHRFNRIRVTHSTHRTFQVSSWKVDLRRFPYAGSRGQF